MEIAIVLVVVILGVVVYFNRASKGLDVNKDGKVDLADAKAAVVNTAAGIKSTVDVNKDGKVDGKDVKVAAKKAATKTKTTVAQAKVALKKAATKKRPAAKK